MVLIKEIELALKPENNEVRAQEDEILADSVLELADTDFTKTDNFEDLAPGSIRKHVEADMRVAYPGKPTSRKRIFKDKLEGDEAVKKGSQRKTDAGSGSDIEESSGDEDDVEEEGGEDDSEADDGEEDSLADESEDGTEEGDGEGEGEVESDPESEEDMDGEFDGSILGDEKTDGSGSEVEEEDDENDKEDLDGTKGIDYFSSRARDIEADVAKGRSIKNQLTIWETLIECRIKLQPCLLNINKLYQKESFQDFRSSLNEEEEQTVLETYSALSNLMKGLLDLQENLLNAVPSYVETKSQKRKTPENQDDKNAPEKKKKKTGTDLLKEIDEDFKPFRNATIQKWNEKTRVSSGKINKNDFSAFDLPTLKQIEEILLDRERLLKRTHTKRSDYVVLGRRDKPNDDEIEEDNGNENHRKKNQGEYDPEIFDDDDFYHKLLRDFIEKKTSDVSDVSKRGKQWLELQKLRSRMKAKVDTRASKGRKLRFTVHNKMVNFMAPVPNHNWTEEAKNELFKSLFC